MDGASLEGRSVELEPGDKKNVLACMNVSQDTRLDVEAARSPQQNDSNSCGYFTLSAELQILNQVRAPHLSPLLWPFPSVVTDLSLLASDLHLK